MVEAGARAGSRAGMVSLPSGVFSIGAEDSFAYPEDGEGPVREMETSAYWIDARAVSNSE